MKANVILIRHAESAAQTGSKSSDVALIPLSKEGHAIAKESMSQLTKPDLIVVSPFIRTRQTAQSLIDLYPDVPVKEWLVQEFTYLDQSRCVGMTVEQRAPLVRAYWERNNPEYIDGNSTESFNQFVERVAAFLKQCERIEKRVYVFSHTMFMQAVRMFMAAPEASLSMNKFRDACFLTPIRNLEGLAVTVFEKPKQRDRDDPYGLRQIIIRPRKEHHEWPNLRPQQTKVGSLRILPDPKYLRTEDPDKTEG